MIVIASGMTPSQFIDALNDNFNELNNLSSGCTLTTVTVNNYVTAINSNLAALFTVAGVAELPHTVSYGNASDFISNLNYDFGIPYGTLTDGYGFTKYIYVSNTGNDATGDGSYEYPYLTFAKVNTELEDNTKVFINRGSTFINDKLDLSGFDNIEITSYGLESLPILSGAKSVIGWTNEGSNIWSKHDDDFPDEITNVLISGVKAVLAKITGSVSTNGSSTTLVDSALTDADGYWDNAEIVINYQPWLWSILRVTSYVSKTFNIPAYIFDTYPTGYYPGTYYKVGVPYYIQNHRNCLTTANTWAYNNITKTLYIYKTSEPTNVTVTYGDNLIYGDGVSNVNINRIALSAAQKNGIDLINSSNIIIDSITSTYSGYNAIRVTKSDNYELKNSSFSDENSDAIKVGHCDEVNIHDNTVDKCGYTAGNERVLDDEIGVYLHGQNGCSVKMVGCKDISMQYNALSNNSYDGVQFQFCSDFNIQYNYITLGNLNHTDGGLIYVRNLLQNATTVNAWLISLGGVAIANINGTILNNILTSGSSVGLYCDDHTNDIEIAYNFIQGCIYLIRLNQQKGISVHHNTLKREQINGNMIEFSGDDTFDDEITYINDNLLAMPYYYTIALNIISTKPKSIYNNKYFWWRDIEASKGAFVRGSTTFLTVAEWTADDSVYDWNRDSEARITPSTFVGSVKPALNFLIHLINPAKTTRTVQIADLAYNDYVDMDGNPKIAPFTMAAYTGIVLVRPT
jgi:hypothetical protein